MSSTRFLYQGQRTRPSAREAQAWLGASPLGPDMMADTPSGKLQAFGADRIRQKNHAVSDLWRSPPPAPAQSRATFEACSGSLGSVKPCKSPRLKFPSPWAPVPVLSHTHRKLLLPYVQLELSLLLHAPATSFPCSGHLRAVCAPACTARAADP